METSEEFEYLNEEFGLQISIDLMKRSLGAQMSGVDTMKETARTLLGASSVIVSLLGALQLVNIQPSAGFYGLFAAGIVSTLVVFAVQMVLTIAVLSPVTLKGPIKAEWDLLYDTFVHKKKNEILRELLGAYLSAIEANRAPVIRIRNFTRYASWLLLLVVAILLSLSLIPRGG